MAYRRRSSSGNARSSPNPTPTPGPGTAIPDTGTRPTPDAGAGISAPADTSGGGLVGAAGDQVDGALDAIAAAPGKAADGLLGGLADAIKEAFAPLIEVGKLGEKITSLFIPTSLVRAGCGIGGAFFIILAIVLLVREVKHAAS